ncbi:alpha/beta hydrolase, partial [Klebsiella michiganensis]|uniref:alpha/beta hydrolase n=1 Tax=Klebsiella michiganensis TaxID=1134687 RepID=UPI001953AA5D
SFLAPFAQNEPFLTRALGIVGSTVEGLAGEGFGPERIILAGFSQGACLALEYAARNARRFGGVAGLSGGLIGPE